jgi:hypothetical protein
MSASDVLSGVPMRWRKWLLRLTVGLAIGILVVALVMVANRERQRANGDSELAAAIAETEQDDREWHWDQIVAARRRPQTGHNSAEILLRVGNELPQEWMTPTSLSRLLDTIPQIDSNVCYNKEELEEIRDKLNPLKSCLVLARTLKDYPDGFTDVKLNPDVVSTPLPHVGILRPTCQLLRLDTILALEDRNSTRANDNLFAMLNTSRSLSDEPLYICQLVRMAMRTIATRSVERTLGQVEVSGDRLAALQAAWALDAEEPLMLHAMRGERAGYDAMFGKLADGTITPAVFAKRDDYKVLSFSAPGWWLYRGRLPRDRAFFQRYCNIAVEIARQPIEEQHKALGRLPPFRVREEDKELLFSCILLPDVEKLAISHWRGAAEARCAVAGLACERFRLKSGRWPESLEELVPTFLAAVPLDPFDGEPLRFLKLDDGVIVSSIGKPPANSIKNAHPGLPLAIGFQLWDPKSRHRPDEGAMGKGKGKGASD